MKGRKRLLLAIVALLAMPAAVGAQHSRLFPPENLGVLEGPDRDEWQRPEKIMDVLGIGEGSVVADLGAGSGWFTIRLAQRVGPNGLVWAEDIQPQMLEAIERRKSRYGLNNVKTKLGTVDDPRLPKNALDAVLIVDAYHEMERPIVLLRNLSGSLKPEGRVAIINFKKDGGGPGPEMEDRVDPERVIHDAEAAGLTLLSRDTFLRYQYMLQFGKKR